MFFYLIKLMKYIVKSTSSQCCFMIAEMYLPSLSVLLKHGIQCLQAQLHFHQPFYHHYFSYTVMTSTSLPPCIQYHYLFCIQLFVSLLLCILLCSILSVQFFVYSIVFYIQFFVFSISLLLCILTKS